MSIQDVGDYQFAYTWAESEQDKHELRVAYPELHDQYTAIKVAMHISYEQDLKQFRADELAWNEQKGQLEVLGYLQREHFERELRQDRETSRGKRFAEPEHSLMRVLNSHTALRAPRPLRLYKTLGEYYDGSFHPHYVVDSLDDFIRLPAPDWLENLYEDYKTIRLQNSGYKVGEQVEYEGRVYTVSETGSISPDEAYELEESFDIFDAAGSYARLIPLGK